VLSGALKDTRRHSGSEHIYQVFQSSLSIKSKIIWIYYFL